MAKPVVAIVGRPNVGKSTLFNKIIGKRMSIVDDTPGVTRDRIIADAEWIGRNFLLIDTGGIETGNDDAFISHIRYQASLAIDAADVIIFVTDLKTGITATDTEVANILMRANKPILLCVNKVDKIGDVPPEFYEFYNLGLGDPYPVSSVHGHGTGDLLDKVIEYFPALEDDDEDSDVIKVAVIGKPNVGKSSLINKIVGEERVIVSDIPGTTRDAVDTYFENEHGKFIFIDTAGIRRKSKVEENIERYSVLRSNMAVERADVILILIDAREDVTEQDTKVAGIAHDNGKASIIVANKWDITEKDDKTMQNMTAKIKADLGYMTYAPSIFISAKTGQRLDRLFKLIKYVANQYSRRITTGALNELLADAVAKVQPPSDKGKVLKLYYITQTDIRPPTFVVFANSKELFHFSYQRYIENRIRQTFGLDGTPIRIIVRERSKRQYNP